MKRFLLFIMLSLALCLLCACGQPEAEETEDTAAEAAAPARTIQVGVVVDTDYVNLRHGPSRDARIVDYIVAGSLLEVEKADPQPKEQENDKEDAVETSKDAAEAEDTAEDTVEAEDEEEYSEEELDEEEDENRPRPSVKYPEDAEGWFKVVIRGDRAYVYEDFLYVSEWKSDDEVTIGTVLKDKGQTDLKSEPSATAEVLTQTVPYQQFIVLDEDVDGKWYKVDYKGEPAYLPLGCLKLETMTIEDALL